MISLNGGTTWELLSGYGFNGNWNIQAFIETSSNFNYFNIYRNGSVIDTTASLSYADSNLLTGIYNYEVTAVFNEGESSPEGPVTVSLNHFIPIWDGNNPYQPMNIIVVGSTLDGIEIQQGEEIGIFDVDGYGNAICVGSGIVVDSASPSSPLLITVSSDDPNTSEIDGYTNGNNILYRAWSPYFQTEYTTFETTYNPSYDSVTSSE